MVSLVQVQTLRGTAGVTAATQAVNTAVSNYNKQNNAQHVVNGFVALAPNTKGMQVQLTLLAVLARNAGCTLVRLSVHNGNVALCGPANIVSAVQGNWVSTYNQLHTLASNAYIPAQHGARMGFINAYTCGLIAGLQVAPATLAYGLGMLFTMPAPGNGSAYALGAAAGATLAPAATTPSTPATTKGTKGTKVAAA